MPRALSLLVLLCAAAPVAGQRNDLWSNPGLTQRGLQPGEQQIALRRDLSACHGAAFEGARALQDEEKKKALGVALFKRCMAEPI
jgi:hypothetical protein